MAETFYYCDFCEVYHDLCPAVKLKLEAQQVVSDEQMKFVAGKLREYGMEDEGCFVVDELAMTILEGSAALEGE